MNSNEYFFLEYLLICADGLLMDLEIPKIATIPSIKTSLPVYPISTRFRSICTRCFDSVTSSTSSSPPLNWEDLMSRVAMRLICFLTRRTCVYILWWYFLVLYCNFCKSNLVKLIVVSYYTISFRSSRTISFTTVSCYFIVFTSIKELLYWRF